MFAVASEIVSLRVVTQHLLHPPRAALLQPFDSLTHYIQHMQSSSNMSRHAHLRLLEKQSLRRPYAGRRGLP